MREKYFDIHKSHSRAGQGCRYCICISYVKCHCPYLLDPLFPRFTRNCHCIDFDSLIRSEYFSAFSVFLFYTEKHYEIDLPSLQNLLKPQTFISSQQIRFTLWGENSSLWPSAESMKASEALFSHLGRRCLHGAALSPVQQNTSSGGFKVS